MKRLILLTAFMVMSLAGYAQQSVTARNMADFSGVELVGKLRVELIASDSVGLEVQLHNVGADRLDWSVKNDILSMRLRPGSSSEASADVKIYFKKLKTVKASASNVAVKGVLHALMLDVDLSAGAMFGAEVDVTDLELRIIGNSAADITGKAKYYAVSATTKSKANTRSLDVLDARVEASSAAEVYVTASERLNILSDSGASVYYRGTPAILRTSTRLMGTVNNIGK